MDTTRARIPSAVKPFVGVHRHRHLAAGGDQDHLGLALGWVGQHVGPARHPGRRGVAFPVQGRQRLAGQHQRHRLVSDRHQHPPGLGHLVGVARAQVDHAGHGPDGGQVLDRLVGRPVLADPDGVVGVEVDQRQLHQCREPQRAALEVGKDQKPGLVGAQLGQRQSIGDRRGRVLTDAEVQVAPRPLGGREVAGPVEGHPGLVGRRQVGRAADQPWHSLSRRR